MSELIVYQNNKTELDKYDTKIIIARIGDKNEIFVQRVCTKDVISLCKCKVFIPRLGFISYKVEKKNGKTIKSATYVKPSKKDLLDAKKYNLKPDFMTYLNHNTDSKFSLPFWKSFHFYIDHIKDDNGKDKDLISIIRYISTRDKEFIGYVLPYVMSISKDYDVCLGYVNKIREFYPFEKHLNEYTSCISNHLESGNDLCKEGDNDFDEVYRDNLYTLNEVLEKELEKTRPKEDGKLPLMYDVYDGYEEKKR